MSLPYGDRLSGHCITVINRSEVVGRPLAALLANDGASVYSVDVTGVQQFSRGEGLRKRRHEVVDKPDWTMNDCLSLSDVVISGVPVEDFKVPSEFIKEGAVCINFSSNKVGSHDALGTRYILISVLADISPISLLSEFLSRYQRKSIHLRSHHREGHHRGLTTQSSREYQTPWNGVAS